MVVPALSPQEFFNQCLNRTTLTDALRGLQRLPDQCVHCIVTSPPYWNLRDYGVPGQMGLEDTPEEFVHNMVLVFREARRVLRDDGTLWLNIGDSYASKSKNRTPRQASANTTITGGLTTQMQSLKQKNKIVSGLKQKDMVGIPWMLAYAMRADGWYLRQDIIWHKPNPMPESTGDRCTKAHEYVFLFAKTQRYYFDQKAIATEVQESSLVRLKQDVDAQQGSFRTGKPNGAVKAMPAKYAWGRAIDGSVNDVRKGNGEDLQKQKSERKGIENNRGGRDEKLKSHSGNHDVNGNLIGDGMANKRSVWSIADPMDIWRWLKQRHPNLFPELWDQYAREALNYSDTWKISTQAFREAHFATFPEELPSLCIRAGTSAYGVCADCGSPYIRQLAKKALPSSSAWKRSCSCATTTIAKPIVLDIFAGAGTTLLTADNLGRNSIGFDINAEYIKISDERRKKSNPLFS